MDKTTHPHDQSILQRIHERPRRYLKEWLHVPAHIHHVAHRMSNPPIDRPQSRKEFQQLLHCLEVPEEHTEIRDKFGFGVRTWGNGDRIVIVWEAHTEYYSYQVWHIPKDKTSRLEFGPLALPDYTFPFCPLGIRVNALDIIICPKSHVAMDEIGSLMPGPNVYGSRVFEEDIAVVTSFTPDTDLRERYLIFTASSETLLAQVSRVVDSVVAIENYYHLVLLPFEAFSRAIDQVHQFEQRLLYQRTVITEQLEASTPEKLQKWLTVLTQDSLQVSRIAESMRYRLSGTFPFDRMVQGNLKALQERPFPPFRMLSDYVTGRTVGVVDGYLQLLRRIDALVNDFDGASSVIRARVDLYLQEQNLKLLVSMDKTTRGQAILQRTVESLSVIVITYYLSGLGSYVLKALEKLGWLADATVAMAVFVPVAAVISFAVMVVGRKVINKRMSAVP